MVSARPQFEAAGQLQNSLLWPTYKGTCLVSRSMLVGIQPAAPNSMAGLAEWLRGTGLWLQLREFDSLISPQMGGSYKGITHGLQPCNASSSLAPSTKFGSGTRRQSAGLKSQWTRSDSVPSHHVGEWPSLVAGACLGSTRSGGRISPPRPISSELWMLALF